MARLIPKSLPGGEPQALREFWRVLKRLPDDFSAWCARERHGENEKPQVFVLWRERYGFLIQVAETSQQLAERALAGDLFDDGSSVTIDSLGRAEERLLSDYVEMAAKRFGPLHGSLKVRKLVAFPNVVEHTIDEVILRRGRDSDVQYLGFRQNDAERFGRRLEALAEGALPEPALIHLRRLLTPESEVPRGFNARAKPERNTEAKLDAAFLDIDQEWCVKNDLELPAEQERVAGSEETRLITGVAGSGKSLVLLYRAVLFAKANPDAKILVLTHNKALRYELERRVEYLQNRDRSLIRCMTFFQWAASCLGHLGKIVLPDQTREMIDGIRDGHAELKGISTDYLIDETGWLKDQAILKQDDYLAADRRGRGLALRQDQKVAVWKVFKDYQHRLKAGREVDWHNVALRFHDEACVRKSLGFPEFDAILIDEAQFFAKTWFEITRAALKPGGHLFLAADPTQGFLRRRQSWISAGIEVRGRTTRLETAYRNTRAILRFARNFYEERRSADDELDLNVPSEATLLAMPEEGMEPEVIHLANSQDEMARAVNEVWSMRERELPSGSLLVIHADGRKVPGLIRELQAKLGEDQVHAAKEGKRSDRSFCSVVSLDAATGLEAPVVMLLGKDILLDAESDPRLSQEEKTALCRDNTRKLYMGFTRAGQRLVIFRRACGDR